jgi:uncharacterized membrane protein YkgB
VIKCFCIAGSSNGRTQVSGTCDRGSSPCPATFNKFMKLFMYNTCMLRGKIKHLSYVFAHIALFIVFFWFGSLKLFGISPANDLVDALRAITIPWWSFGSFIIFLGIVEMLIGALFLSRRTERLGGVILIVHMFTTMLPLLMLPEIAWQGTFVPTLEGQYIIKNIVIVALAASIVIGYRKK